MSFTIEDALTDPAVAWCWPWPHRKLVGLARRAEGCLRHCRSGMTSLPPSKLSLATGRHRASASMNCGTWSDGAAARARSQRRWRCSRRAASITAAKLSPGETGHVLVLASTVQQAKVVFGYIKGYIEASPLFMQLVDSVLAHEIRLKNHISISVHPSSFRSVRGRTLLCAILDEVSFWRDDASANPDVETYRAILPSLATTNGMLVGISHALPQDRLAAHQMARPFRRRR